MEKTLYYQTTWQRSNAIKAFILDLALGFCSYPRLLFEVFIRKNFGERYFTLSSCIIICVLLAFFPIALYWRAFAMNAVDMWSFFKSYGTWYAFVGLFMYVSIEREQEIKRNPSVFDFAKFSLYSGDISMFFWNLASKPDRRKIETLYEPAPFFVVGLFLWAIGQPLGTLLMFVSVIYSLSYFGAYRKGDNFIMDIIDDIILQESFEKTFVDDEEPENNFGIGFQGRKPTDRDLRKRLIRRMTNDEFVEAR